MFYDSWGFLLARADAVLRTEVRGHVSDPRAVAQLDTVATLLGDLAAMWPRLFASLEEETRILARAVGREPGAAVADPLRSHREVLSEIDRRVEEMPCLGGEQRRAALGELREAILAASAVQGRLLEQAVARAAQSKVRRI